MEIEILGQGAFESALVHLEPGERFVSESGALYRAIPQRRRERDNFQSWVGWTAGWRETPLGSGAFLLLHL